MNCMPSSMTRRHWIGGALAIGALGAGPEADPRIEAIRARAKKAEMQPFDESETAHYLAIGDASGRFRTEALGVCEAVAADYLKVFQDKGFEVALPREKLVVVVLLGRNSYAQFEGGFADDAVGGHFDLDDNRLVMFDFRGTGANPKAAIPEQDNTLALVHETIHQLTYNTGLLDRKADVPLCISEGLATFGETWAPRRRHQIGERNARRLLGRAQGGQARGPLGTDRRPDRRRQAPPGREDPATRLRPELDAGQQAPQGPGPPPPIPRLPNRPPGPTEGRRAARTCRTVPGGSGQAGQGRSRFQMNP